MKNFSKKNGRESIINPLQRFGSLFQRSSSSILLCFNRRDIIYSIKITKSTNPIMENVFNKMAWTRRFLSRRSIKLTVVTPKTRGINIELIPKTIFALVSESFINS